MPSQTRIAAGKLRHSVDVVNPNSRQDANGNLTTTQLEPVATLRASIQALTGRELYNAQQKVAQVTHRVTVRYYPGLKASMLVQFIDPGTGQTRQFQIQAIENPDEIPHVLFLLCIERDDSAREP